jgi:hypothetical protein
MRVARARSCIAGTIRDANAGQAERYAAGATSSTAALEVIVARERLGAAG